MVLNPIRAGMVNEVADYHWSSYRELVQPADVGRSSTSWLEADWLLSRFDPGRKQAIAKYVGHVRAGGGLPSVWQALRGQIYLGSEEFMLQVQARLQDGTPLRDVPLLQRRLPRRPLADIAADACSREAAMAQAFSSGHYTQREIAAFYGVHEATVSRVVRRAFGRPAGPV